MAFESTADQQTRTQKWQTGRKASAAAASGALSRRSAEGGQKRCMAESAGGRAAAHARRAARGRARRAYRPPLGSQTVYWKKVFSLMTQGMIT